MDRGCQLQQDGAVRAHCFSLVRLPKTMAQERQPAPDLTVPLVFAIGLRVLEDVLGVVNERGIEVDNVELGHVVVEPWEKGFARRPASVIIVVPQTETEDRFSAAAMFDLEAQPLEIASKGQTLLLHCEAHGL